MQCLVRDHCDIYNEDRYKSIVHIADEVDAESDPLKCEVIIEGADKSAHYIPSVAKNITKYYEAVVKLGFGEDATAEIAELDRLSSEDKTNTNKVLVGTRLRNVFDAVKTHMIYNRHFGWSQDPDKIVAVPFDYAGVPSPTRDFSDLEVAAVVFVLAIKETMRPADIMRLHEKLKKRFGDKVGNDINDVLGKYPKERAKYYATQFGLPSLSVSKTETAVSFVDLFGAASRFVGFSGTMGTVIKIPEYETGPRFWLDKHGYQAGGIPVIADKESNVLVKRIIDESAIINVPGQAPGLNRAREVIEKIYEDMKSKKFPARVCIIDGSGEFGAFENDLDALGEKFGYEKLEYFDDNGDVVHSKTGTAGLGYVRYYSHRNSRGVDSKMDNGTVGYCAVSKKKTTLSEGAQAMYRLRKLATGMHTVTFVVTYDEGEELIPRQKEKRNEGNSLYHYLKANDDAHGASAAGVQAIQIEHAKKQKNTIKGESCHGFDRPVEYKNVEQGGEGRSAQKQQVETKVQLIEKQQTKEAKKAPSELQCFERTHEAPSIDVMNTGSETDISEKLAKIDVGISYMMTTQGKSYNARRAFAVSGSRLVVMTLVEVWAKYRPDAQDDANSFSYYTHDGIHIRGPGKLGPVDNHDAPLILLGRYLCDDELGIRDEIRLVGFLERTYNGGREKDLLDVMKCLYESKFITESGPTIKSPHVQEDRKSHKLLGNLKEQTPSVILGSIDTAQLAEQVANNNDQIIRVLMPILGEAITSARAKTKGGVSFGRRKVRVMRAFV